MRQPSTNELGMPATSWTDDVGWNTRRACGAEVLDTVTSPDGRPCIAIDFQVLPKAGLHPKALLDRLEAPELRLFPESYSRERPEESVFSTSVEVRNH